MIGKSTEVTPTWPHDGTNCVLKATVPVYKAKPYWLEMHDIMPQRQKCGTSWYMKTAHLYKLRKGIKSLGKIALLSFKYIYIYKNNNNEIEQKFILECIVVCYHGTVGLCIQVLLGYV